MLVCTYQTTRCHLSIQTSFHYLLFGLWGYWHCGHSWPIVPASGDSEDDLIVEKQMECRLAGEAEVLRENLPQCHFCPSQNPTWPDPVLIPGRCGGKPATNNLSYGAAFHIDMKRMWFCISENWDLNIYAIWALLNAYILNMLHHPTFY
jgi:hypothetical protein